jgi:hypothetical protein
MKAQMHVPAECNEFVFQKKVTLQLTITASAGGSTRFGQSAKHDVLHITSSRAVVLKPFIVRMAKHV